MATGVSSKELEEDIKVVLVHDGDSKIVHFDITSSFQHLALDDHPGYFELPITVQIKSDARDAPVAEYINKIPEMVAKNQTVRQRLVKMFQDLGTILLRLEKKTDEDMLQLTVRCTEVETLHRLRGFCFPNIYKKHSLSERLKDILDFEAAPGKISFPLVYKQTTDDKPFVTGMIELTKLGK
ncbi:uncharacterized protein [Amphiura filiformis]|uniref:uncharacterized protein n=1 Tax=Amphiura filiformis TaxID=82378 RepID=UPI003B217371